VSMDTFEGGLVSHHATMFIKELKDFSSNTSIHGLNQVANDRAPPIRRLIWFCIFIGSLVYAGQQLASTIKGIYQLDGF